MSLLDQLKQALSGNALSHISQQLGTDEATAGTAVDTALPVIVSGLARNASTPSGASALNAALAADHGGGGMLDNITGMLGGGQGGGIGAKILSHVFGNRQSDVATGVGHATGLDASKAAALLAMLAPVVMGALGRARQTHNLDPQGLASMLGQERQGLSVPTAGGLGSLLGMLDANHDGSITDDVMGAASRMMGRQ